MPKIPQTFAFNADDAREHMEAVGDVHLVAIHRTGSPMHMRSKWFGRDYDAAIAWAETENREHKGIYVSINAVPEGFDRKPGDVNITHCRFCHVDLDPPHSGGEFPFDATLETFETMRCPPSFIVKSGGGLQAWWRIEPSENKDAIRNINLQIRHLFNADACQDVSRLFRLAGTVNFVNAAKAGRGRKDTVSSILVPDDGTIYEPAELSAAFPPVPEATKTDIERKAVALGNVEYVDCDALGLTPFHPVRRAIEKPKGTDRSAYGYHAAAECVRAGLSDAEIAGLLLNPDNEASGHFIDQSDPMRAVKRAIGAARGEEDIAEGEIVPVPEVDFSAMVENSRSVTKAEVIPQKAENTPVRDNGAEFDWYPMLTPGLKLMVDTVMDCSPKPRLELALGSALSLVATAAGRRYMSPTGLLTNIYLTALMPAGGGKDFPLKAPARVLALAQLDQMIGGRIVSAMGIRAALEAYPVMFVPIDEMGKLLTAMNNPRGVLKDAVAMLLELYSDAQGSPGGGMYANRKERESSVIHHPCMTMFGVATPSTFWEGMTSASVSDGFLPRMILLTDDAPRSKPRRDLKRPSWSDTLIEHVKLIASPTKGGDHNCFTMGDAATAMPRPYPIPYADQAADDAWWQLVLDGDEGAGDESSPAHLFYGRMAENATKLAMIRAIDRSPDAPELTVSDFEFGGMLARRSVLEFDRQTDANLADNEYHARLNKVREVIARAGEAGIAVAAIGKACPGVDKRAREAILEDLEERGDVVSAKQETGGRPRIIYRAA